MIVMIMKTKDGLEIIGEIDSDYETESPTIAFHNPLEIKYRVNPDTGYQSAVFSRYNYFSKDEIVHIWKHAIVSVYTSNEMFSSLYRESVESMARERVRNEVEREEQKENRDTFISLVEKLSGNTTVH